MSEYYLAGDIGGTKTLLALFSKDKGPNYPLEKESFPSKNFKSLGEIVKKYLSAKDVQIRSASFGVAGPVEDQYSEATNLPWKIDAQRLSSIIHDAPVKLLNDLLATAYAVPYLSPKDVHTLVQGEDNPHGVLGVIAPGTGLGEAFLLWNGERYAPYPSEGGHANFGPASRMESELLDYMLQKYAHVSYERVCSGSGVPDLYGFLRDVRKMTEPAWLKEELASAADPTRVILQAAVEDKAAICSETLNLFLDILANEAGNLALKVLPAGGIYIGGGIPPRILPKINRDRFQESFINKGRLSSLLHKIPVHVILKSEIALFGAACHGFEEPGINE